MSNGDGDRVQVVGLADDQPPRRASTGFILVTVGLVVGLVIGVLVGRSDPDSAAITTTVLPTASNTTTPMPITTTTDALAIPDEFQDQIDDLEFLLEAAQQKVFELGLESAPAEYASVVGCNARQQASGAELDSYFVGPVGFWFPSQDLSAEGEEAFVIAWAGIEAGDSVTLVVPSSDRDRYSLFWDPATWRGDRTVVSGEPAVTLRACDGGFLTVFAGGFVLEQNYCAPLDVYFGDDPEPERIILPFGIVDCPDGPYPLVIPELAPVPDVTGLTLREARLAIRLAALEPRVSDGDPIDPYGMVWGQKGSAGETPEPGSIIGLRTCQPADDVVATYQARLDETGVTLSEAWMAPSHDRNLEAWYFASALVSGGPTDGQVATWALPGFPGEADLVNTPNLSFPVNGVSQGFGFGDRRFTPEDYGATDWLDLDGAIASQRCVKLGG